MVTLGSHGNRRQPGYLILRQFPSPEVERIWQDFVGRIEFPGLYITPHYFLEPYWKGKNPFAILAMNDGRVTGVLTGIATGGQVTCGNRARPQVSVDPAGETLGTAETLAKALDFEFPQARVTTAYSWVSTLEPGFKRRRFRMRQLQGDVVLDLRPGADALFQSFHDNRKRNIRAAIRRGVAVSEVNTAQDLADFWDVHCAWEKTKRKTIRSDAIFENVAVVHRLRETHLRFIARAKGKAIAATTVRFFPGGLIEYAANCSMNESNQLRPNDLLIWTTIQWACNHGFSRYSLGAAHPFLTKCGGAIFPIYRYRLDRSFLQRVELQEKAAEIAKHIAHHFQVSRSVANKCLKRILAA